MNPEIAEGLDLLECKTAFLSVACMAISALPPLDCAVDKKAWTGLYLWTLDLETQTRELNELAQQE